MYCDIFASIRLMWDYEIAIIGVANFTDYCKDSLYLQTFRDNHTRIYDLKNYKLTFVANLYQINC